MQRKLTRIEIAHLESLKKSDIQKLFVCSWNTAVQIFNAAAEHDDEELGRYRFEKNKVRTLSVCFVKKMSLHQLYQMADGPNKTDAIGR